MLDIETIVHSRIKAIVTSKLKTKYPDISFTTSDKGKDKPKFPNVYTHMLGSKEEGGDLENKTINGVSATFQIETTDNQSQSRAKEVMDEVVEVMKGMSFSVISMPEFQHTDTAYRRVARFKKTIGSSDVI